MEKELSPVFSHDQRLRTRLHELRAKAWIDRVVTVSGLDTPYKLNQKFGGGQRKWKSYQEGTTPNERTIQAVEVEYQGTRDWIERGPSGLALWPALGHKDIDVLHAIAHKSSKIDGDIARLRLDAANNLIEVQYPPPAKFDADGQFISDLRWPPVWFDEERMSDDNYVVSQQEVMHDLYKLDILPSAIFQGIAVYLYELLQPYRLSAYRAKFEDFYDAIMDTRRTYASRDDEYEEFLYQTARMESIGNKGRRSDVE